MFNEEMMKEFMTNKRVMGLVRLMKPLDVCRAIAVNLDMKPKDAAKLTAGLLKHSKKPNDRELKHQDGGNQTWPVPTKLKKAKPTIETGNLRGEPEFQKHLFPPEDHRSKPGEWPYDEQNVAYMNMKKGAKRGHNR